MSKSNDRWSVAVLISDIHYSLSTLSLADSAMRQAIDKAAEERTPLIVAGDLHDTKAIIRGECAKVMIETFKYAETQGVECIVLVGNHDLINEKSLDNSLEFLAPYVTLIKVLEYHADFYFIPYQASTEAFEVALNRIRPGNTIIMHQGVTGASSGEYLYDKSAISKELLSRYRVISGHYHKAQDIKCGPPRKGAVGLMSYIGSPYSVTYAEANDGPKGFQVLYNDGILEQVPTNLRKHVIIEATLNGNELSGESREFAPGDLIWVKLKGTSLELDKIKKHKVATALGINHNSFKLDKIVTDAPKLLDKEVEKLDNGQILDMLIDKSQESEQKKTELKALWRSL